MLLSGRCEVFGLEEGEDLGFVVRDAEDVLVSVVGCPGSEAIEEAVAREWEETLSSPRPKIALMWPRRCRMESRFGDTAPARRCAATFACSEARYGG